MAIQQFNWPLMKMLVSLRRIAAALDRLAPPPAARPRRRAEFSVSSAADFNRGYDAQLDDKDQ